MDNKRNPISDDLIEVHCVYPSGRTKSFIGSPAAVRHSFQLRFSKENPERPTTNNMFGNSEPIIVDPLIKYFKYNLHPINEGTVNYINDVEGAEVHGE